MSTDSHGRRICDGCYRPMVTAHKVHQGSEYCATCYSRQFASTNCPTCEGKVVCHVSEQQPPSCGACLRERRSCARCHRPAPDARVVRDTVPGPDGGMPITHESYVCPSCYPYTTPELRCPICERPSQRLSGAAHLSDNLKACPSCINRHSHATCVRCRKYRKVISVNESGGRLCIACTGDGPAVHKCPGCGSIIKGAGNAQCDACSIAARLRREVALSAAAIEREWVASLFTAFGEWLLLKNVATPGLPKIAVKALAFFRGIDLDPEANQPIVAADLIRIFDSKQLRTNLNVTRFLSERYGFQIDDAARAMGRDQALIARGLQESASKPWLESLVAYKAWLEGRPSRTQAQYFRTAQAFCEAIELSGSFTQEHLVNYLESAPGSRANLSVWVTFVRTHYGWTVTMPPKISKKPALKLDALALLDVWERVRIPGAAVDGDLATTIELVYGFEPGTLRRQIIGVSDAGDLVTRDGTVKVQQEMKEIVAEWSRRFSPA